MIHQHTYEKLNDKDKEITINILESLVFENYKAIRGESKSSRHKFSKTNFQKSVKNLIYKEKE